MVQQYAYVHGSKRKIIVLLTIIRVQYLSRNLTFQNSNTLKALTHTFSNCSHSQNSRIASLAISLKLSNFGMLRIEEVPSIYRKNNGTIAPTLLFVKVLGVACFGQFVKLIDKLSNLCQFVKFIDKFYSLAKKSLHFIF